MSETGKHTPAPGPWSLRMRPADPEMHQKEYPEQIVDANGKPVVLCCVVMTSGRDGEPLANARLIAAAPDMLAALQKSLLLLVVDSDPPSLANIEDTEAAAIIETYEAIAAALSKATGTP